MAAYTKIIELFGLPGCGKSTTVQTLISNRNDFRISTFKNVVGQSKKHPLKLIASISLKSLFVGLQVRFSVPFDKKRRDRSLFKWLLFEIVFNYIKKYTEYDFVLVDPGVIQGLASWERGDDLHMRCRYRNACSNYLRYTAVTDFIYCDLPIEEALMRMHHRNRNNGRIDLINDEKTQLNELRKEKNRFDFYAGLLKEKKMSVFFMNMNQETSLIVNELQKIIGVKS